MFHQISIKGLTILKKKSTYYYMSRSINGLTRSPDDRRGTNRPEWSKVREDHVSSNFYQGSNNTKKKSTYQYAPHIRISYITVFQNKSNILESRFSANDHMISSD